MVPFALVCIAAMAKIAKIALIIIGCFSSTSTTATATSTSTRHVIRVGRRTLKAVGLELSQETLVFGHVEILFEDGNDGFAVVYVRYIELIVNGRGERREFNEREANKHDENASIIFYSCCCQ